jgi:hypothetical protein
LKWLFVVNLPVLIFPNNVVNEEDICSTRFERVFVVKGIQRGSEVTEQQPIRNSVESRLLGRRL